MALQPSNDFAARAFDSAAACARCTTTSSPRRTRPFRTSSGMPARMSTRRTYRCSCEARCAVDLFGLREGGTRGGPRSSRRCVRSSRRSCRDRRYLPRDRAAHAQGGTSVHAGDGRFQRGAGWSVARARRRSRDRSAAARSIRRMAARSIPGRTSSTPGCSIATAIASTGAIRRHLHAALRQPDPARRRGRRALSLRRAAPMRSGPITIEANLLYRKFDTTYSEATSRATSSCATICHHAHREATGSCLPIACARGDADAQTEVAVGALERLRHRASARSAARGELRQAGGSVHAASRRSASPTGRSTSGAPICARVASTTPSAALARAAQLRPARATVVARLVRRAGRQAGRLSSTRPSRRCDGRRHGFADARKRGFDFSLDYRVSNELGNDAVRARAPGARRGAAPARDALLRRSRCSGSSARSRSIRRTSRRTTGSRRSMRCSAMRRPRRSTARPMRAISATTTPRIGSIAIARRANPAADHAAEAIVIYDLQRPGALGLGRR